MKLSCLPVSYFKEIIDGKKTIKEWAREANEIGFDYIDFSHPSDIFLEIVNNITEIKKIPLGILFDTANPLVIGEDPLMILEQVIDKVVCVHAADISTIGQLNPVTIGTGIVPFESIFKLLKKHSFDGLISIEEVSRKGREAIEFDEKFIRQKWESPVL